MMTEKDKRAITAEADSCLCHAKRGTFAIMRTPDGGLWYVGPGTQSHVLFLRVQCRDCIYDEKNFLGILAIRDNPKKDAKWFVHYTLDNKQAPYLASSWEDNLDFSCVAIVEGTKGSDGSNAPICVLAAFQGPECAIVRAQDAEIARALLLLSKPSLLAPMVNGAQRNAMSDDEDTLGATQDDLAVVDAWQEPSLFGSPDVNDMWI